MQAPFLEEYIGLVDQEDSAPRATDVENVAKSLLEDVCVDAELAGTNRVYAVVVSRRLEIHRSSYDLHNGTWSSSAIASAVSVLPVPGRPCSATTRPPPLPATKSAFAATCPASCISIARSSDALEFCATSDLMRSAKSDQRQLSVVAAMDAPFCSLSMTR